MTIAQKAICLFLCLSTIVVAGVAQRGLPPRAKTKSTLVTKYPQHLDFLPEMVKLLKVPDGWEVSVAAYGLGRPRMLYTGLNGELYITRRDAGDVLMLKDADGDNKFEDLVTVAADFKGVHGSTMKDGWMYLCNNTELRRYKMNADGTLANMDLINDLPSGGQHPNRTIDFGSDGIVYHPDGFLLVDNTNTGKIYKVDINNPQNVQPIKIDQYFLGADGLLLNDNNRLTIVVNGGNDKIFQLTTEDNWQSAKLAATTLAADRFIYPATATRNNDNVWLMNAKFNEVADSNAMPAQKFAIQRAVFKPVPK